MSLAGRSKVTVDIQLHWIDDHSNHYYTGIGDSLTATARDLGPIDISALNENWTGDIESVWFEFSGGNVASNVRIGWVKLTE